MILRCRTGSVRPREDDLLRRLGSGKHTPASMRRLIEGDATNGRTCLFLDSSLIIGGACPIATYKSALNTFNQLGICSGIKCMSVTKGECSIEQTLLDFSQ